MLRQTVFALLCVIALSWLSTGHADQATPAILVLGDSLSAGYGIDPDQGWVALMEKRLAESHYDYRVFNASVSGETSGGGLARLPRLIEEQQPTLLLLALGANDGLRGFPIKIMRNNLREIIKLAKNADIDILLIGIQIPLNYGPRYTNLFEQSFVLLSEEFAIPLMPTLLDEVPLNFELMQTDRLHPNSKAQPLLLDNIWPHLQPLLDKP